MGRLVRALALLGIALLLTSEILTPPMSPHGAAHHVGSVQIVGLQLPPGDHGFDLHVPRRSTGGSLADEDPDHL